MKLNLSKENKSKILFISLMALAIFVSVASIYASEANNSSAVAEAPVGITGGSHQVDLTKLSEKTVANDTVAADNDVSDKTVDNTVTSADNECLSKMSDNAMSFDTVKVNDNNRSGKISDQYTAYEPADNNSSNVFTMSAKYTGGTAFHWIIADDTHGVDLVSVNNEIEHPERLGSTGTTYFNFHINSDDYYVHLLYVDGEGNVIKELDSDMLN